METPKSDNRPISGDTARNNIWNSSVPIVIEYQDNRLSLNIPRLSFLVLAYDKIRETFGLLQDQSFALVPLNSDNSTGQTSVQAIETHLPAGLLYDLNVPDGTWVLTISLDCAQHPRSMKTLRAALWNNLKQNELIRNLTTRRIQNLTPSDSLAFADSMLELDFLRYWSIGGKIMTVQPDKIRHYPVRIYLSQTATIQELVPPRIAGARTNIRSLVMKMIPRIGILGPLVVDVVVHGVIVDWNLELDELLDEAQYVDGWLYIVIRLSQTVQDNKREEEEQRERQEQEEEGQKSRQETTMEQTFQQLST